MKHLSKINVWAVIYDHLKTLKIGIGNGGSRYSRADLTIFYILPLAISGIISGTGFQLSKDAFSAGISLFSIFAALLFSAQVAMYGIFRSERRKPENPVDVKILAHNNEIEKTLLIEVNSNISYLILGSCISVSLCFFLYAFSSKTSLATFLLLFMIIHFILTLLMLIKRAHLLFDNSYKTM